MEIYGKQILLQSGNSFMPHSTGENEIIEFPKNTRLSKRFENESHQRLCSNLMQTPQNSHTNQSLTIGIDIFKI